MQRTREVSASPADCLAARRLRLALAALWVFDAVLQYQAAMFRPAFGRMLADAALGNPGPVAAPALWAAHLTGQHPGLLNAVFASVQLLLGLGVAWRPTLRPALAASAVWAFAVWWLGEGLGGVLTSGANPVTGAPGAALLYGALALLLWPARADRAAPGAPPAPARVPLAPGRAVSARAGRALWMAVWGGLAFLAANAASSAPVALPRQIANLAAGEPSWLAGLDRASAGFFAGHGTVACAALAALLALVAAGPFLPDRPGRVALIVGIAIALTAWAAGQDFGGVLTGMGTDPGAGPVLALFALACWPRPAPGPGAAPAAEGGQPANLVRAAPTPAGPAQPFAARHAPGVPSVTGRSAGGRPAVGRAITARSAPGQARERAT